MARGLGKTQAAQYFRIFSGEIWIEKQKKKEISALPHISSLSAISSQNIQARLGEWRVYRIYFFQQNEQKPN